MKRTGQLLNRILISILLLNIVIAFASNVNTTVDCFVVNRYIGDTAAAVMAIYFPLKLLTLVPMFLISGGTNVVCSKLLGEKKWQQVDRIYIGATVFMVAIQLFLYCLMYFAPERSAKLL